MNGILIATSTDPYRNLALEELLFASFCGYCLYLWQNENTVVIGRNQNPWKECAMDALSRDGVHLVRRASGGGAVFHDLGNLNFSFITPKAGYDLSRQLGVILSALQSLGILARFTGRNDMVTADGAKFSGNAFRKGAHNCLHHGTLLIRSDLTRLSGYLLPSPAKLKARGVDSVRARVTNLSSLLPGLTIDEIKAATARAFEQEYGPCISLSEADFDGSALREKTAHYRSDDWNLGATPDFDLSLEQRFCWGELRLELALEGGRIARVQAWSDAMDEALILSLPERFTGLPLNREALSRAAGGLDGPEAADIARWLLSCPL